MFVFDSVNDASQEISFYPLWPTHVETDALPKEAIL